MKIFDMLAQKLNIKNSKHQIAGATNPIEENSGNEFLNTMSKHALKLYEKQCDIKNFTKLALSDPENTSHNERVEQLLKDGVFDPLEDTVIEELAKNKELWDDLGL
ncbi:hypothetical protein IKP85_05365 [bacterium]|nr:hypothetical protein [bacterium]